MRESERETEEERERGGRGERDVMKLLPTGMSRRVLDEIEGQRVEVKYIGRAEEEDEEEVLVLYKRARQFVIPKGPGRGIG